MKGWSGRGCPPMPRAMRGEIRVRVARGETWPQVAGAVGVSVRTVGRVLKEAGRVPPRWTARHPRQLSLEEREEIAQGIVDGESFASIGRRLVRSTSTVSREVNANGGRSRYRVFRADEHAYANARRPKAAKLVSNPRLARVVEEMLLKRWSPEQIAARLR